MKEMTVTFSPCKGTKGGKIVETIKFKGKLDNAVINKAMDKLRDKVRKNGDYYLEHYTPVETDRVCLGYCPICKERVEYKSWYGFVKEKCKKGHDLLLSLNLVETHQINVDYY